MISVAIVMFILSKRDRVIHREKIKIMDISGMDFNFSCSDNTYIYLTHFESGRKKINYLTGDQLLTMITWLNSDKTVKKTMVCGFWQELYYLAVVAIWNRFQLYETPEEPVQNEVDLLEFQNA
ncbi:MAG: hypothetical protein WD028_05270 [Balneolaceae bacterium]